MKYNQPYGISDPNAAFINGNPTTGTMGSIPPAESIEYDQREVVAVIQWAHDHGYFDYANVACANPSNTDLTQLLKAIFGIFNSNKLTAPQHYYVNTATGSDNNNGTSTGTAFKTIQRAVNQSSAFNLNGFSVTISVADGTYGKIFLPAVNGTGSIFIQGNSAIPGNCIIHSNAGAAVTFAGSPYYMDGFRFESDAPDPAGSSPGVGIWGVGGNLQLCPGGGTAVEFGVCAEAHILLAQSVLSIAGGTVRIAGNSPRHIMSSNGSWCFTGPTTASRPTLVIPAAISMSGSFIFATAGATATVLYAGFSGAANVTGAKYAADTNGVIQTGGSGINYYPGSVAGSTSTGGQYL
jgi:hypothetical protein